MDMDTYILVGKAWSIFDAERRAALEKAKNPVEYGDILARYELIWETRCNKLFGGEKNDADGSKPDAAGP